MFTQYAVMSEKGVRSENQDNFCIEGIYRKQNQVNCFFSGRSFRRYQSFFVMDGMGGEEDGRQASFLAARFLANLQDRIRTEHLSARILEANRVVSDYSKHRQSSVGTALAGLVINRKKITAVNVGDTRIYQLHNRELIQISVDHTLYQFKVNCGMMDGTEKEKHILTQYLGVNPEEFEISPFLVHEIPYRKGDIFFICSDGIYGVISDEQMKEILLMSKNAGECCAALVQTAILNNGKDNMTVVVVCI